MDPLKVTPPQETKLHFLDYWRIIRIRKTVILAVFLLVVITATLVTFILPESYSSTAKIKIERDRSDIPEVLQAQLPMGNYDPYFIQTEFEVIQSELILGKVIESQHLQEEWGKKFANGEKLTKLEAINSLKSRMALHPVRNTIIIEIQVFSDKPKEAADIANAIAEAYQQHRLDERKNLSTGGIAALLEARNLKEAEIVQAQTNVDRLRRELNISDSMASEYAAAPLLSAETLRHINGLRLESEANFVQQETLLNHLNTLKPEVLRQTLPTALQDNLLGTLLDQKTYADQRLLSVEKDYGALHPDVIKARALVADLEDKIDQRVKGVMVGLGARVDALGQSLTNLNRKVEEATSNDIVKANQSAPYFAAKRRLEELTRFRTLLDTKIASEKASEPAQPTVPQARLEASDVAAGKPGPAAVGTRTEIVLPAAGETKYAANESLGKEAFESSLGWLSTQREIAAADRKDAAGEETAAFGFRLGGRQAEEARPELGAVRPGALGLAGAPASRESVGVHELANADPQEVQRVLSDLFSRGGFSQDGRRRALLGQANPLTQRSTQQTAGLPPGTTAGPGQFPAAATIGDAYFTTDPESRRVVTIADEATARAIGEALAKSDTTASGVFGGGMMGGMGGGMRGGIPTVPKASEPAQPTLPQARLEASG